MNMRGDHLVLLIGQISDHKGNAVAEGLGQRERSKVKEVGVLAPGYEASSTLFDEHVPKGTHGNMRDLGPATPTKISRLQDAGRITRAHVRVQRDKAGEDDCLES